MLNMGLTFPPIQGLKVMMKATAKPDREWQVDGLHFEQWYKELLRGQYLKLQVLN